MSNYSKLYWLTRLDYFQNLFITMAVIGFLMLIVYMFAGGMEDFDKDFTKKWKWARNLAFVFIIVGGIIASLIPTRQEIIFIIAGGKTINFIQTDSSIQKIPGHASAAIDAFLESEIKKLKSDK